MDEIWSLGARYCLRQHAHAFIWFWLLVLAFAAAALIQRRRERRVEATALALLAALSAALGLLVFYACSSTSPYSLGLGAPDMPASRLTTSTCLGQGAATWAFLWSVAAACVAGAVGLATGVRRRTSVITRVLSALGATIFVLIAAFAGFVWVFDFSWCSSQRLF